MSNTMWNADVQRWEVVKTDRQNRLNAKKDMDAAAAAEQGEAPRASIMNLLGHYTQAAWKSQQSVVLPANFSLPLLPSGYTPSPGYSDGNVHGCFNPNITFSHGAPQRSSPSDINPDPRTPSPAFNAGFNTQ
ncbi:putative methionyl-tRNA synthetase [Hordeum vulgare]|nr:putative methionyl-tRNA synthetase [Hordeum vulgare]